MQLRPFSLPTQHEIKESFKLWSRRFRPELLQETDLIVCPLLGSKIKPFPEQYGWIRRVRKSLFLSTRKVASQLNMDHSSYIRLEKSESNGSISLNKLAKIAEAMDCELVYVIRSKSREPFSLLIWNKLWPSAARHPWVIRGENHYKIKRLAAIAGRIMRQPKFRKKIGWASNSRDL